MGPRLLFLLIGAALATGLRSVPRSLLLDVPVITPRCAFPRLRALPLEVDSGTATNVLLGLGVIGAGLNFLSYWTLQLETARILGGVPRGSVVTELDALDGKNIFYLPEGVDYTGVMLSSQQGKEKAAINEQLILESIGKANGQGGGRPRQGKLRSKSQDIRPKSQDVVLSIGAIGRCSEGADKAIVVNEAFRLLKPGGLFVFLEPGGDDVLELVGGFFPKEIVEVVAVGKSKAAGAAAGAGVEKGAVEPPRVKPGIVSTPVSVPLRSFLTGICIRP